MTIKRVATGAAVAVLIPLILATLVIGGVIAGDLLGSVIP